MPLLGDKMNGKIIKITDTTVYIGYEDGAVKEISRTSLEFKPVLGDPVEIYGDFVTKSNLPVKSDSIKNRFKRLSLTTKINIIVIFILLVLLTMLQLAFTDFTTYLHNILTIVFILFPLVLSILNLFLLILSLFKKSLFPRLTTVIYLVLSLAILIIASLTHHTLTNTNNSTSRMETSKTEELSSSSKLNQLLKDNIGKSISIQAEFNIPMMEDSPTEIKNIMVLKVNGVDYGAKYMGETLKINTIKNPDEHSPSGNKWVTMEGKIVKDSDSISIKIIDVFTADMTFDEYISNREKDSFETLGVVEEIEDTDTILGTIIKVRPIWFDLMEDNEINEFYFKNEDELKILLTRDTEEYIEKHYRKMEVGDTVNLLGSVVTIDGVNVLSANNSGSVQGVERKD